MTLKTRPRPASFESPPRKRRRTSQQREAELEYWGEVIDEDSDCVENEIAHDTSSDESWGWITAARKIQRGDSDGDATAALHAGEANEGEASEIVTSYVEAPATSELSCGEEGISKLENAVKLLFQKNAEQRDMLVEVMELIMAKSS